MINEVEGTITLMDENQNPMKVQVLFSFEIPDFKKKYIVYTLDAQKNEEKINVIISEINYDTLEVKPIPADEKEAVFEFYSNAKEALLKEE